MCKQPVGYEFWVGIVACFVAPAFKDTMAAAGVGGEAAALKARLSELDKSILLLESQYNAVCATLVSCYPPGTSLAEALSSPLIDKEGFPIATVDVYRVRHLRADANRLRYDIKEKAKEIDEGLKALHAAMPIGSASAGKGAPREPTRQGALSDDVLTKLRPFAIIGDVTPGSPAATAGLQKGDKVLQFADLACTPSPTTPAGGDASMSGSSSVPVEAPASGVRLPSLTDLAALVRARAGETLNLAVSRDGSIVKLKLTPQPWSGPGLLGCMVLPAEP